MNKQTKKVCSTKKALKTISKMKTSKSCSTDMVLDYLKTNKGAKYTWHELNKKLFKGKKTCEQMRKIMWNLSTRPKRIKKSNKKIDGFYTNIYYA